MNFRTGDIANGVRTSSEDVEYKCWFDAIEAVLTAAGLYLVEVDEDGNEVE